MQSYLAKKLSQTIYLIIFLFLINIGNSFSQSNINLSVTNMGAGKTTLIKAICHSLGVNSAVSSPTFSLVNEYEYPGGLVYHFDCYRLKTPTEALDFGIEEYLSSDSYCFIEWPEKIADFLPSSYLKISISNQEDAQKRHIQLEKIG